MFGFKPRLRASLTLVVAGGLLLAACSETTAVSTPSGPSLASAYHPQAGVKGGNLTYSSWLQAPGVVEDFNVLSNLNFFTQEVAIGPIWASLWVFDRTNRPIPDLVSEIPTVANGDVIKIDSTHMDVHIKLKQGLNWSDGTPLTAADVQFTVDAICDPTVGASSTVGYDHIASQEIKSNTEIVWHFGPDPTGTRCGMASPLGSGLLVSYLLLNTVVMPKEVLGSIPHSSWATSDYFTKKPTVTSGPYAVQYFTTGPAAIVTMIPNPHYADGRAGAKFFGYAPYLNKLVYRVYDDKSTLIAALKSGDTDLALDLVPEDLPALENIGGAQAVSATGLADEYLNFNLGNNTAGCESQNYAATCGTPTLWANDQNLRHAIALAIDKQAMINRVAGGIGKAMNSPFGFELTPYYDASLPAFKRDIATANAMLTADGWVVEPDGIRVKDGQKLAWTISTVTGNLSRVAEEKLLISNWKDIGASVTPKNFPGGLFFDDFAHGGINATGQFDIAMYANNWSADPDNWATSTFPDQIPSATNPAGSNWDRISDPTLAQLFTAGANELDGSKRVTLYNQAQVEWEKYLPTIELYELPFGYGVGSNFGNFVPSVNTCNAVCNAPDWFPKGVG